MHLTATNLLRRIINSSYHPFHVIPKPSVWPKRERLRRFIAWQYGSSRTTVRRGYAQMDKIFHYMNIQRTDALRNEIFSAEQRLQAALGEHHVELKCFKTHLANAHILLDDVALSQLAVYEPRTFRSLVDLTKKIAVDEGKPAIAQASDLADIHTTPDLRGAPFLRAKYYPRGPGENHTVKPRKLREDEY